MRCAVTTSNDQKFIHRELPRAISANELEVYYQPIVSSQGGRMVGVEALLRWTHATRGAIEPTTFIPAAEQMGLMDTIGAFVLRRTLQNARRWPDDLYVAVNLSPLQVRDRTIVDTVRSALTESGVAPSRLVLEITEGVRSMIWMRWSNALAICMDWGSASHSTTSGPAIPILDICSAFPSTSSRSTEALFRRLADRLMVA
jgi:predicted signal transduction protein with EAL and GGDEF domain